MGEPGLYDLLDEPLDDPEGRFSEDERWLLQHAMVMHAVLERLVPEYLEIRQRVIDEGPTESLNEVAFELAGLAAGVLQSARRRPAVLLAAEATEWALTEALAALDLVLHSLVILTDPGELEMAAEPGELELHLDQPFLRRQRELLGQRSG